uniref:PHD-type domain-containing protein n=1 Tax=Tetraodon nigroviridis TaxID=99883 RepID=H3CDJ0_TETNG
VSDSNRIDASVAKMAASAATANSSFGLCPNYAVICSFLERYGALLDLPELTFPQLERYLQDTSSASVPKLLVDLHVKLLRKIGKSVSADRWEKYLVKVCQEFNTTWAWELEQKGYKEMQTECKAAILKYLCECQFDENVKFKTAINEEDPDQMRVQPIGRDKDGQMYWFQLDQDDNVRVYVEEQDDLDGSSWKCIVKNRNDLAEVVALLKTQIDPELLKREQEKAAEADEKKENKEEESAPSTPSPQLSNISLHQSTDVHLPSGLLLLGEAKKEPESSSDEDSKDDVLRPSSPKTSQKVSWTDAEASSDKAADVSGHQPLVKTEPLDDGERRTDRESSAVSVRTENGEDVKTNGEVKKSSTEEIQQVLKSQQQAKIPLKKRGMKFSQDFDKNSSLVVPKAPLQRGGRMCSNGAGGEKAQPERSRQRLQSDPKPSEAETQQPRQDSGPEEAPPSPKHAPHQCEKSPEEHTHTEGPGLKPEQSPSQTPGAATQMEEGPTDGRGEEEAIRELPESADKEAPPGRTLPPPDPDTAGGQRDSSQEVKTTGERTGPSCREAPEKQEHPKEQTPDSTGAGGGGAEAASEQETGREREEATPHREGSRSVEGAGEEEEPSEGTTTPRETDLKPARTEEEEHKSLSPDNTKDSQDRGSQVPPLDPPAGTKDEEDKVEKQKQSRAEEQVSEGTADVHEESEQPAKEEVQTEESGDASTQGGTSPEREAVSQKEVVNGGEALPGPQATSKRPVHRRRAQVQAEDWPADAEAEANVGRSLRRSPRISRPTAKTVEIQDKSSQNSTPVEKQEEKSRKKNKATQKKPREKKVEQEGQTRSKGRKRRKVRWSNTRTHRKKRSSEDEASNPGSSEEEESEDQDDSDEDYKDDLPPNDDPCKHCGLPNHPELILLCDWCDSGYHTACLRPPLMVIPDGEWFCPPCQHKQLCDKLQEQLQNLDAALKKKERAERRKERLIYVGISVENIIAPSVSRQ